MAYPTSDDLLARVEQELRGAFPGVRLEFVPQTFPKHVELWIHVLDATAYDEVAERCKQISAQMGLEDQVPEIWLVARMWTVPWPGGESEEELRHRRDDFRRRHNMPVPT